MPSVYDRARRCAGSARCSRSARSANCGLTAGLAVTDAGWAVIKERAPAPVAAMRPRRMAVAAALSECWLRAQIFPAGGWASRTRPDLRPVAFRPWRCMVMIWR